jgi:hypothetical protein
VIELLYVPEKSETPIKTQNSTRKNKNVMGYHNKKTPQSMKINNMHGVLRGNYFDEEDVVEVPILKN